MLFYVRFSMTANILIYSVTEFISALESGDVNILFHPPAISSVLSIVKIQIIDWVLKLGKAVLRHVCVLGIPPGRQILLNAVDQIPVV
jgi:hypothetical protein